MKGHNTFAGLYLAVVGATMAVTITAGDVENNSPQRTENYKQCTEMDIYAEGQAFDLSSADLVGCTDISLWNMNMEDEGIFSLTAAMAEQKPCVITKLDLGYNKISPTGAAKLAEQFSREDSVLEWLNINGNEDMEDEGVEALLGAFANHKHLKTLDMGSCNLGADVTDAVVNLVKSNTVLEELWLNTNKFATGGTQILAAVSDNTALKKMILAGNEFGDATKIAMERLLTKNKSLKHLDLANNALTDAFAESVARGLVKNNVLTNLDLDTNQITEAGGRKLAAAMGKNTALVDLQLGGNQFEDDDFRSQLTGLSNEKDANIRKIQSDRLSQLGRDEL